MIEFRTARQEEHLMTTPTGIPIVDCETCGKRHPVSRQHCPTCGMASLFGHDFCGVA